LPCVCFSSIYASMLAVFSKSVVLLLRSEIPRGICAKLCTVAASNNREHPTRSLYYCLFAPHRYIFVLRAHPVRCESHNQRNTTGEVATLRMKVLINKHPEHEEKTSFFRRKNLQSTTVNCVAYS